MEYTDRDALIIRCIKRASLAKINIVYQVLLETLTDLCPGYGECHGADYYFIKPIIDSMFKNYQLTFEEYNKLMWVIE